jgi:hypothetical protein
LTNADPHQGRFRSFMLSGMNHFLADEQAKLQTRKRGGGHIVFSLDLAAAEERLDLEPADDASPDKIFDKQWAAALLVTVLNQLAEEYRREGKTELFEALKLTLNGTRESQPYSALASSLMIKLVVRVWAATDPTAALAGVRRMIPAKDRDALQTSLIDGVAESDPALAEKMLLDLPGNEGRGHAAFWLIDRLAKKDPDRAEALLGRVGMDMRLFALDKIASTIRGVYRRPLWR